MNASAARAHAAGTASSVPSDGVEPAALVEALMAPFVGTSEEPRFSVVSAPLVDPERALAAIDGDGIAFIGPDGDATIGLERAFEFSAGIGSLAALRSALVPKLAALRSASRGGGVEPFALGAIAFDAYDATRATDSAFAELGRGAFVIPRVAYAIRSGKGFVVAAGRPAERARLSALANRLLRRLAEPIAPVAVHVVGVVDSDAERFGASVADANVAIARGDFDKVVLARRMTLTLDAPIDAASLLRSLGQRSPNAHRFLLSRGSTTFVGATPERLVACRDGRVSTVALAGTTRPGAASELVASRKDRAEHRWVVDAIRGALEPLCEPGLSIPTEPHARELRDLVHLESAIEGRLIEGRDVFDVIEALHPTPAVGGAPREPALAHIARAEPFGRGFYAAPFGIVDASGDADVVVALRSGVFHACTASLFAGSGIVAGSVPDTELAETDLKLRALLGALGDEPAS